MIRHNLGHSNAQYAHTKDIFHQICLIWFSYAILKLFYLYKSHSEPFLWNKMRFWTGFGPVGSTENVQREKKNQMQF